MKKTVLILIAWLMFIGTYAMAQDDVEIDESGNITTGTSSSGNLEVTGASAERAISGLAVDTGGVGVYGENSTSGTVNYGRLGHDQYGVYGFGIPWAGYFSGDVRVTGNLTVDGGITYSETDPVFTGSPAYGITSGQITNWDTAYGWGDHSIAGYLTVETDPTVNALGKASLGCAEGKIAKVISGVWDCGADDNSGTTYSAGIGIDLTGTTFSVKVPLVLNASIPVGALLSVTNSNDANSSRAVQGTASDFGDITNYGGYFQANGNSGKGVYSKTIGDYGVGVLAESSGDYSSGVNGKSTGSSGSGVRGSAIANDTTGQNYGGYFTANGASGMGVFGQATGASGYGGYFVANGTNGRAVYSKTDGTYGYAVHGKANGTYGRGVYGESTSSNGRGVYGKATDASAYGGYFEGRLSTDILEIRGGADIAEPFDVSDIHKIKPGMVVSIDSEKPGQLRISDRAYDRTVAGIVSGANGIRSGLTMTQEGSIADGTLPVSLTGRVYVWADASKGSIEPGDMLTTSDTPGHAMKVTDYEKAHGAVLGKAMSWLNTGKGLVLVLVTLQ